MRLGQRYLSRRDAVRACGIGVAAGLSLMTLSACVGNAELDDAANPSVSSSQARTGDSARLNPASPQLDVNAELDGIVKRVQREHGSVVGVALTSKEGTFSAGRPGRGPAWSTIKVPIAIAALRDGAEESLVDEAIKVSDNDAAYALWSEVKWREDNPTSAIDHVLESAGSKVSWQPPDANGDVSFGYATWLLEDQATFGARMRCIPDSAYVYDAMEEIVDWQSYGLTGLEGVHAKGGWGFDEDTGIYTQRQFGTLETEGGTIGLAILSARSDAAETGEDAAFDAAVETLDDLAGALGSLVQQAQESGALHPIADCS